MSKRKADEADILSREDISVQDEQDAIATDNKLVNEFPELNTIDTEEGTIDVTDSEFKEMLKEIFTQSIESSVSSSKNASIQASQQNMDNLDDVDSTEGNMVMPQGVTEEKLKQEYLNETLFFPFLTENLLENITKSFNIDIEKSRKIILSNTNLILTMAMSLGAIGFSYMSDKLSSRTNLLISLISTGIAGATVVAPERIAEIMPYLNLPFLWKYITVKMEIQSIKDQTARNELLNEVVTDLNSVYIAAATENDKLIDGEQKNANIKKIQETQGKLNAMSGALFEASSLKQDLDFEHYGLIMSILYAKSMEIENPIRETASEIVNLIYNETTSTKDLNTRLSIVNLIANVNVAQANNNDELKILLGELKKILEQEPKSTTAGGGSWFSPFFRGGKRKTHKKAKKSNKSKKHHKKHHKKTAHKKHVSRRK
jgi:hypothetical protein